jgi:hypothetical protein
MKKQPNPNSLANLKSYKKGESGNPGGKPVGARNALAGDFVNALADDFRANGKKAIETLRKENPAAYVRVIADLLPKQEEKTVNVEHSGTVEHRAVQEVDARIKQLLAGGEDGADAASLPH